jgi:hypothetical protein
MNRRQQDRFQTKAERMAEWLDTMLGLRVDGLVPVTIAVSVMAGLFAAYEWAHLRRVLAAAVVLMGLGCVSPSAPIASRTVVQHVTIECVMGSCAVAAPHGRVQDRTTVTDLSQFPVRLNIVGAADTSGLGGVGDFGFNIFYTLTNVSAAGVGCTTQSCNTAAQPGTEVVALGSVDETIGDRPITLYNFNTTDTLEVTSPFFLAYEMTEENGTQRDSVLAGSGFTTKGQPVANNVICAFGPGVTIPSTTQGTSLTGNPCVNPGQGAAPYELTYTFNQTDEPATWRITLAIVTQVAFTMDAGLPTPLRLFGGI